MFGCRVLKYNKHYRLDSGRWLALHAFLKQTEFKPRGTVEPKHKFVMSKEAVRTVLPKRVFNMLKKVDGANLYFYDESHWS